MDRKSIIIVIISFILLLLWVPLTNFLWPPVPAPQATNQMALQTNVVATQAVATATTVTNQPIVTPQPAVPLVTGTQPEELVEVETAEARFIFTSHGGGLKTIELKNYPEVITCNDKGVPPTNRVRLNAGAPLPILAVLGGEAVQGDGVFRLTRDGQNVRAEKTLTNGLRMIKEFSIGSNYLITVKFSMVNQSGQPMALPAQEITIGTASILGTRDDPMRISAYWFNKEKKDSVDANWFAASRGFLGCGLFPREARHDFRKDNTNIVWADIHTQFFAIAAVLSEPAVQIHVVRTNLPALANVPGAGKELFALQASLVYPAAMLAPTQALDREFVLYTGPKEYKRLARISARLKTNIDAIMDYGGFFGWFAQVLLSSMNGLHRLGLNYAMAIIAITVIIKLLFWPLTNASTKSMKRMAALQPQMKAIQEKYKDNPAKMNREIMDFMKKNRVSPLGGCLPMLLQIPVFFGFFKMIQSAIELRGEQFLWVCDLSKADTIFVIPGVNFPINPLPLIMGATMLWQARLTPPSPGMDPMQQNMMKYMPLIFLVFLYNFSAGLTLYWTVQNLLTIAQMKLTKTKDQPGAAPAKAPPGPPPKKRK
jgi:YidC/Oxa1 family membrane protein insertase